MSTAGGTFPDTGKTLSVFIWMQENVNGGDTSIRLVSGTEAGLRSGVVRGVGA
jgi:hypothetical protein